jgi:D-beta-D-heptose 7-phosphate kinase/D-beta-D-heptose 1-phosphate adenosyltransferase
MVDRRRVRELIAAFDGTPILVVGDAMLDQFLVGRVERISPEAPVPVVAFDHHEVRLGGAANVAHNIRTLGGRPSLVGCVGDDEDGRRVASGLKAAGIEVGLVTDPSRPTTKKLRIVTTRNQQVARVDFETDAEASGSVEAALVDRLTAATADTAAIIVSDYLKGVVTRRVMAAALAARRGGRPPVLVDPKIPHIDYYRGATLITPNHQEAEVATHRRIRSDADARDAAREFRRRVGCESVLITRGEHGMWLLDGEGDGDRSAIRHEGALPAVAREVADVTGAGDTVIGTIALALAAGGSLVEAAELATHAAGLVVGRFGPAALGPADLLASVEEWR